MSGKRVKALRRECTAALERAPQVDIRTFAGIQVGNEFRLWRRARLKILKGYTRHGGI